MSSSMSWAGPEDVYLSTSLAGYLDSLYVIRGENVVLIGELDPLKQELPQTMTLVSEPEIRRAQKVEREASELKGTMKKRMDFLDMD